MGGGVTDNPHLLVLEDEVQTKCLLCQGCVAHAFNNSRTLLMLTNPWVLWNSGQEQIFTQQFNTCFIFQYESETQSQLSFAAMRNIDINIEAKLFKITD